MTPAGGKHGIDRPIAIGKNERGVNFDSSIRRHLRDEYIAGSKGVYELESVPHWHDCRR
jgi:hypothetical protein